MDFLPETDFPDVRNRAVVHSENGSCMAIPQELDKIRLYLQLDPKTGIVDEEGRLIKSAMNYQRLFEVAKKSFHPYRMEAIGPPEWWSIYKSRLFRVSRWLIV
jgi:phenol 2-monooxygenase (NADPH)